MEPLLPRRPEQLCGHGSSCLSRNLQEHLWHTKKLVFLSIPVPRSRGIVHSWKPAGHRPPACPAMGTMALLPAQGHHSGEALRFPVPRRDWQSPWSSLGINPSSRQPLAPVSPERGDVLLTDALNYRGAAELQELNHLWARPDPAGYRRKVTYWKKKKKKSLIVGQSWCNGNNERGQKNSFPIFRIRFAVYQRLQLEVNKNRDLHPCSGVTAPAAASQLCHFSPVKHRISGSKEQTLPWSFCWVTNEAQQWESPKAEPGETPMLVPGSITASSLLNSPKTQLVGFRWKVWKCTAPLTAQILLSSVGKKDINTRNATNAIK